MMKHRRLLAILLAAFLVFGNFAMPVTAFAEEEIENPEEVDVPQGTLEDIWGIVEETLDELGVLDILTGLIGEEAETGTEPYTVTDLYLDGHVARWSAPEGVAEGDYIEAVSYTYVYSSMNDLSSIQTEEGAAIPDFDGSTYSFDLSAVYEGISDPTSFGCLGFIITYLDSDNLERSNAAAYEGRVNVHYLPDTFCAIASDDGKQAIPGGGTAVQSGTGHYVDEETVSFDIQADEGYSYVYFAHKNGSDTTFALNADDDLLYFTLAAFNKVCAVTLETGDPGAAQSIAERHRDGLPLFGGFKYDGGTSVTYFVPTGDVREIFYRDNIAYDAAPLMNSMAFMGIGRRPMEEYSSREEIDADMDSLPSEITGDETYYVLWQQPVGPVEITLEIPERGTKIKGTGSFSTDITQSPTPKVSVSGARYSGDSAYWLNNSFDAFNGTVGSEPINLVMGIEAPFGRYFGSDPITVNGEEATPIMNFYGTLLLYYPVSSASEAASAFVEDSGQDGVNTSAAAAIGLAGAAAGLGGGYLLGRKKKKA